MPKVELRPQRVSDAKRFFAILHNSGFRFFTPGPKTLEEEKKFLRKNAEKRRKNIEHNYTIFYDKSVVGGCGIKIDQHRPYNGEIGYFVDKACWGKGIATRAVRMLERVGFRELKLHRIEIIMNPKNRASIRVAEKAGYKREARLKEKLKSRGRFEDVYLYAKIKN